MKNWNSKISKYTPIVKDDTIRRATKATSMREMGIPVRDIARQLKLSKSRIYEYLRKDD